MTDLQKPSYSTSKRAMWICGGLSWGIIYIIVIGGLRGSAESVALANIVVPSMVAMLVTMLGIHRGFGALDMRTILGAPKRRAKPQQEEPA